MTLAQPILFVYTGSMKTPIRWILVFPAALAGGTIVQLMIALASYLGSSGSILDNVWYQFIASIALPVAFVKCGTITAPSYHRIVAMILAILFCTFILTISVLCTIHPSIEKLTFWKWCCIFVNFIAAIWTAVIQQDEIIETHTNVSFESINSKLVGPSEFGGIDEFESKNKL